MQPGAEPARLAPESAPPAPQDAPPASVAPAPARVAHGAVRGLAAAIYGQVVVTSVVAALEVHEQAPPAQSFATVAATMLVFWLAHAYAEAIAGADSWRDTARILREEGGMVIAALPTLFVLVLGIVHVLSRENAALVAVYVGVVVLFLLAAVAAHRIGRSAASVALTAVLGGLFGLVIVVLKVLSH